MMLRMGSGHRRIRARCFALGSISILILPGRALAGMPSLTLTDIAAARLQTISFFLMVFLLASLLVKLLWNWLRRDFPRLPRLTYLRAVGLVALWGFVFSLVLTMISGARELLTPGAWERDGAVYRLTNAPSDGRSSSDIRNDIERQRPARLETLKDELWVYARAHSGDLPPDDHTPTVLSGAWETADPSRIRFIYVAGRKAGIGSDVVAYEPEVAFTSPRWALLSDGRVTQMLDA